MHQQNFDWKEVARSDNGEEHHRFVVFTSGDNAIRHMARVIVERDPHFNQNDDHAVISLWTTEKGYQPFFYLTDIDIHDRSRSLSDLADELVRLASAMLG